jgi:SAM-dependent methyltransferase
MDIMMKRFLIAAIGLNFSALLLAQDSPKLVLAPPVQAMASSEKAAITGIVDAYSRGFSAMDPEGISRTLHSEATYSGGVGGANVTLSPYSRLLAQLRKMPAGAGRNQARSDRTLTDLFIHGDLAAAVVLEEPLPPSRAAGTKSYHCIQLYKSGGNWEILNAAIYNDRYQGQADDRILDLMGIRPGMVLGEIGAGDGRYTLPLARRVGDRGKVYANDIDPEPLAALRELCKKTGTKNVESLVGKVDDPTFPAGALDLAIMVLVYHHLDQPVLLLQNLKPSLKPGAAVVIVDPAYDRTGEKDSDRPTTRERVEAEADKAGYELITMDASLPRDNLFILGVKGDKARRQANPSPASPGQAPAHSTKAAILEVIDTWWRGHDTDDEVLLEKVLHPDTRTWFGYEGKVQYLPYSRDIERIKSGKRRPVRDRTGEKRSVVDFAQSGAVAVVTMMVESPAEQGTMIRGYTTFQLYKADDRWLIVNLTSFNEPVTRAGSHPESGRSSQATRASAF